MLPAVASDAAPASPSRVDPRESSARFFRGYFAETLHGDAEEARRAYRQVLSAGAEEPRLAALAALRLAELAAQARRRRVALDLAARAEALAGNDPDIASGARQLQARLASVRAQDIEVRGPPAGTALEGASPEAARLFAEGEALLASYHRRRLEPRLELLRATIRSKRAAMELAVRAYRNVAALGEPVAEAAAEFRIASLYYDLSLSLTFDLPSELESEAASQIRRSLAAQAVADRRKARAAYKRSLSAAQTAGAAADRWRDAARLGLSSVEDLLRGGE